MSYWRNKAVDDFPCRREVSWPLGFAPSDPSTRDRHPDPDGLMIGRRPETFAQALMEAPPNTEPQESVEEQMMLADELADAIDRMDERLRWVFQAHVNRGMSFSEIGTEMGVSKTHAHYLFNQATDELQSLLENSPETQARLK